MLSLYASTGDENYRAGFEALRSSIDLQPRNPKGGLQYYVYPGWSYLDGMFSLCSFYATYNKDYDRWNATARADLVSQLGQLWNRTRKAETGLLVHGYDYNRKASWADPVTGASPIVWGRSLGWYVMALVDVVELFAERAGDVRELLVERFAGIMEGVVRVRDEGSGVWWQVMDQGGRKGNYLESSASAMFVYAMLKGVRLGYLEDGAGRNWTEVAVRGYRYIVDEFVVDTGNGTLEYDRTVSVCSLNSTATFEYYVNQPIAYNSVLGTNAFILASLEYERLQRLQ
ncbi:Six-hairpin glycosidase-like protein [Elsinoe ampelina]|uniref:Six-hairpin glycosidase-like protein n=1 Tax=Elsinoe ampelina TaxID=302913 RepID=A0A6A6G9S8_9PEZI|nr:Six-hairpin glycosidase-like protein [Elsinoe ampelina]